MNTSLKERRKERLMPGGIPRYVRCYDNHGETIDRYTVVFTKRKSPYPYLGMSDNPYHPQGIGMHGEEKDFIIDRPNYGHLGKKISFMDLPFACRLAVILDYKGLWGL